MARLSLRLLGTLQVTLGRSPVTSFESDKERMLLAFLAEESQQPHHREKLVGLLWPEFTESAGRNNLRPFALLCAGVDSVESGLPVALDEASPYALAYAGGAS